MEAGAISATVTNLMEQPKGSSLPITEGSEIVVPIHPYEILSVRVDYAQMTDSKIPHK
jgi:alpha-mannosidase